MAKNTTYRGLSASKKGTYSHDSSPLHSSKLKKDNQAYFQPSDLDSQLKISSRNGQKKTEPKLITANVFINNLNVQMNNSHLNQRKISAPVSATITNRKNSKQYAGLTQKEEALLAEYRQVKSRQQERTPQTNFEENPSTNILGGSSYEIRKNSFSMVPRPNQDGSNDLSKSSYIPKFKGSDPNNKFTALRSPPKALPQQPDQQAPKFKKPNSRGQNSFDVNAGPSGKYTPYLNSYAKPPSTANNSPRNRDSDNRVAKTEAVRPATQSTGPKVSRAPLDKPLSASKANSKSPLLAASKHRKTPSFDVSKRNEIMAQKTMTPPMLDRMRKSADYGESRQGKSQQFEQFSKNTFRFAIRTRAGVAPNGTRKVNQDSFIFHTNYGKKSDRYLVGVCDGHGQNGHLVSGFIKETLPVYLLADPNFDNNIGHAFTNAFELCHQKLLTCDFDCRFSGTTSIVLMIDGNRIISANAGDSRAIMGRYSNGWDLTPLSIDHKPNSPGEAQRIMKSGGRIEPFRDYDGSFVGPHRVWLMNQDIPGLAMSRSIGDYVAASVGVSCLPELREFTITPQDKFLIVASDGVWEFIESIDVLKIIIPFYEQNNIEGACDYLMNVALKKWQEEEEVVVDDITLILIFF